MTGREVYNRAVSFLIEPPEQDGDFLSAALELINAGIAELSETQKSRCLHRNEPYIEAKIQSLEEEIKLDLPLCHLLSIYLASNFLRDDLNDAASERFYTRFTQGKERLKQTCAYEITDVYGGDQDAN